MIELAENILLRAHRLHEHDLYRGHPPEREGDPLQRCPDITLINTQLGWTPQIRSATGSTHDRVVPRPRRAIAMTVLVTGGAGYTGTSAHRPGASARAARRRRARHDGARLRRRTCWAHPSCVGDIADEALVRQICGDHGVTAAIHFAAYKSVGET